MTLSTVFCSINVPDNPLLSHSVLPVLFLSYWPFQLYIFLKVSLSPKLVSAQSTTKDYIRAEGETFIQKYVAERTNKAEIRPAEQSEKVESCPENLWNEIQLKGP